MNKFDLLERALEQQKNPKKSEKPAEQLYTMSINARMVVCAPKDRVLVSIDYKNQEVYVAAVESGDPLMLNIFSKDVPDYIPDQDGQPCKNPRKDFHTLTIASSETEYFAPHPEYKWDQIARKKDLNKYIKGSMRDAGKKINFGCLYLMTAKTMSDTNCLNIEKCKQWIADFKSTYNVFNEWALKICKQAKLRGWIENSDGRVRYINDSNSKGDEDAGERMAVNAKIQGLSASISKLGQLEVVKAFEGTPARVLNLTHDEIVIEVPGKWELDEEASFEGEEFYPVFKVDDEAKHWAKIAEDCLSRAEEHYFRKINPNLDLQGLCESAYAPYWAH